MKIAGNSGRLACIGSAAISLLVSAGLAGTQTQTPPPAAPPSAQGTASPSGQPSGAQAQESAAAGQEQRRQPRAKSQEEMDAYQKFMAETNPDQQIRMIEDFLLQYPNSELKEYAYQSATQAYQAKNDYNKVLTYGELTLAENQNNLVALLILSAAIPERTAKADIDRESKLTEAEQYATRALEVLSKMPMPANMTPEQWVQVKKDAESTPHGALGMIALIRDDYPKAESEFKMATEMAAKPDPITLYRLGICYSFEKKYDPALQALDRSASSGGVKIAGPDGATRDLVAEAKSFVMKAKAAAETPVSGAPAAPNGSTQAPDQPQPHP